MTPVAAAEGDASECSPRTVKLVIEYDGTDFAGWQVQPEQRTVQGEIERALEPLCRTPVRLIGAGRTDAGVHALGQVASFRNPGPYAAAVIGRALNATLPRDIRILGAEEKEASFDARRDAARRIYRYVLSRRHRAVGRSYAWMPKHRFALDPMIRASEALVGDHVWKAFCKPDPEEKEYRSRVFWVRWQDEGDQVVMDVAAERFFRNMVRIVVGTLVEVGRARVSREDLARALHSGDRSSVGPTAPPHGLFLLRVEYD